MLWRLLGLLVGAAVSQRINRANATKSSGPAAVAGAPPRSRRRRLRRRQRPSDGAAAARWYPRPVTSCGSARSRFRTTTPASTVLQGARLRRRARKCVTIVACPFCGGTVAAAAAGGPAPTTRRSRSRCRVGVRQLALRGGAGKARYGRRAMAGKLKRVGRRRHLRAESGLLAVVPVRRGRAGGAARP